MKNKNEILHINEVIYFKKSKNILIFLYQLFTYKKHRKFFSNFTSVVQKADGKPKSNDVENVADVHKDVLDLKSTETSKSQLF